MDVNALWHIHPDTRRGRFIAPSADLSASVDVAMIAAAERPDAVVAVISSSGQLDLARNYLPRVIAPVLFIVGENDTRGKDLSREALEQLHGEKQLETIGGVTDPFEDANTREGVARLAIKWCEDHLGLG